MRIVTSTPAEISSGQHNVRQRSDASDSATKSGAVVVQISDAARSAGKAGARIDADVQSRIATIRSQLASGDYPVNLDRLAEAIADEELALAGE